MLSKETRAISNRENSRFRLRRLFFLLHNCSLTVRQLYQIHANIVTNGFSQKNFILVKVLSLYGGFGRIVHALQVFDRLPNPSTALWNQIIRAHLLCGDSRKSIQLLRNMECSLVVPDGHTFNYVINGCAKGGLYKEGEQVHGKVLRSGFLSNVFVSTSLVDFYVKSGGQEGVGKARHVFDQMDERNVVTWNTLLLGCVRWGDIGEAKRILEEMPLKNAVSWTTLIAGCARNDRCYEALLLFNEMRKNNVDFDQVTLVAVLSACAELGDLSLGKWIHSYVVESLICKNQPVLVSLNNSLIHMYSSCGDIDAAFSIFNAMENRTVVSWTSMIVGFAKQGYGDEALSVFRWMENMGDDKVKPDYVTLLGVLCACSHSGYVDVGHHYFNRMIETWGIKPRLQHYGCIIDLFSRAGFLDEAYELVKSMPMKPNDAIWGALLGGCRIYKNVELASDVADLLAKELHPGRAAGYLVLLSNVFAADERWEEAVTIRKKMIDARTRKFPGRSWIQVERVLYEFMAGERSDRTELMYEVLDIITRETRFRSSVTCFEDSLTQYRL